MTRDMTEGHPFGLILRFALPMILGTVFQQIYIIVDMFIVGNALGSRSLAAIGATSSAIFFMLALATGMCTAFTAVMSRYFGAKDQKMMSKTITSILCVTVVYTLIISLFGIFFSGRLMKLLNTPDDIIDASTAYCRIYIGLTIGQQLYLMSSAILQAVGDSRTPLKFLVLSSVLNVLLDLLLVRVFGLGLTGAAIASVISQTVSGVLCVTYMFFHYKFLRLQKENLKPDFSNIGLILKIGVPIGMQTILLGFGDMVVTGVINSFGTDVIAANAASRRLYSSLMMICQTISFATAVYAGQNFGAGQFERIKEGFRKITIVTLIFSLFVAVLMFCFGSHLVALFISDSDANLDTIITISRRALRINSCFFVFLGMIWMYCNTLRGMGDVAVPLASGITELVCKVGFSVLLGTLFGYFGACFAEPIGWALGLVPGFIRFHKGGWIKSVPAKSFNNGDQTPNNL